MNDRDRAQPRFANLSHDDVLKIHNSTVQVVPQNKLFTFDHVFGTTSTQEEIFSAVGESLIRKFVEGYNITILAYGQTSSGKTYTMGTAADGGHNTADEGIVPRSMALLFDILNNNNNDSTRPISPTSSISSSTSASNKSGGSRLRPKSRIANRSSHIPHVPTTNNNPHKTKFTVKVSFIEIYNEDLHDLLNSAPLEELPPITIREDTKGRIYWTGVKEVVVHSTDDVLYYLEQGTQNRATGSTDMNEKSSRSHAIFSVSLKQEKWVSSSSSQHSVEKKRPASSMSSRSSITPNTSRFLTAQQDDGEWLITTSKFHFVDLAGSERLKRTAAEGDRRKEGININAGLLALGNVISALGDQSKKNKIHVPYRDSKLTRLLQDSLGGSATTLMIACASPVEYNLAETLNTLQYANRARNIKNRSEKNQVEEWMTTDNIELLRSLIGKLKSELTFMKSNPVATTKWKEEGGEDEDEDDDMDEESETFHHQRMLIADLQRQLEELDGEASVTRERNRIVEKELQRVRMVESMMKDKHEQDDFQHLVEPVIEEYEKSVSKLESQLALTRAALNHSDMGHEEQQAKLTQLENLIRSQEQTISELRLRLGKVLEREQSSEEYIHELETKLMKSASETTKDQEMLNDLKNKIMKLKETDENTEQYIHDLEKRLAAGEAERSHLRSCIEDLESKIEAKERTNLELLKRLSKADTDTNTEKLILKELDEVNAKFAELEKERDNLQLQVQSLQRTASHRNSTSSSVHDLNTNANDLSTLDDELRNTAVSSPSNYNHNRRSLADEKETPSSIAALSLMQSEMRVKEETERANKLQLTLDSLQYDHQETLKELDEVLQRYHETLEQLDFLERDSSSTTAHEEEMLATPKSLDLSKEIAQAKEDAYEQEKRAYVSKIATLEESLNKQREAAERVQKLEHELSIAQKQIDILKQMEADHKATAEVETILEKLDSPTVKEKEAELNKLLESEKQQTKQWKTAHHELKEDIKKMTLDLDEKESYIADLKQQIEDNASRHVELQTSFDEVNGQTSSLQKRLAETLASFTVLKLSHDGLLKKQQAENAEAVNQHTLEKQSLIDGHQVKLSSLQNTVDEMNQVLKNTTLDKEAALEKITALEAELKAKAVNQHNLETQSLSESHQAELSSLQNSMNEINQLLKTTTFDKEAALEKIASLEVELKTKAEQAEHDNYTEQERLVAEHETRVQALTKEFEAQTHDLSEKLVSLESELELSKNIHEETLALHNQRLKEATAQHTSTVLELEEQIHKLEAELVQHQGFTDDFQKQHVQQLSILQSELSDLKNLQADRLQAANEEHQKEIDQLKTENSRLLSEHEKLNAEYENIVQQVQLTQVKLEQLEALHAEQQTQHEELKLEKQTHESRVSALQNELEQLNSTHAAVIVGHKEKLGFLQAERDALASSIQDSAKLEQLEAELRAIHAKYQTDLESSRASTDESTKRMKVLQKEHDELKKAHAEQIATLDSDHRAQLEHLQALQSQLNSAHEQQATLQSQLDTSKMEEEKKAKSLENERTSLTKEIVRLESELRTVNVTLAQQNEEALLALKALHSEQLADIHKQHSGELTRLETELAEFKKEKETTQHSTKELTEEIARLENMIKNNDGPTDRITKLEEQLKQIREENIEYSSLSEELEKEIHRMTVEKEALAEDLDMCEESIQAYQEKMNDIKITIGVESDDDILNILKEMIKKRSTSAESETQGDRSSAKNNDTLKTNNNLGNDGSGAISQQGPDSDHITEQEIIELKKELKNYQNQLKDSVSRETMDKLLNDEKQKLESSLKANQRLEKQVEELLKKKSSFMCF